MIMFRLILLFIVLYVLFRLLRMFFRLFIPEAKDPVVHDAGAKTESKYKDAQEAEFREIKSDQKDGKDQE